MAKKEEKSLRLFMMSAFWLRMLGCILYSMVMQYYYGYGDSFTFYSGGNFFTNKFAEDLSNIRYLFSPIEDIANWYSRSPDSEEAFAGYFSHPSGNTVMKISAILSYLSFNRFLIISLFFGFFSFVGQWKLFKVFDEINNKSHRKLLVFVTLYSPSIWFWGSGLMKDSLCLGAFGFIIALVYNYRNKKELSILQLALLLFLAWEVWIIKPYIISVFAVTVIITLAYLFIKKLKNFFVRLVVVTTLLLGLFLIGLQVDFSTILNEKAEDVASQIEVYKQDYERASDDGSSKGGFTIEDFDPSFEGILLRTPGVIFSCLYRPFLWESRKVMILFTSLESTLLLLASLYLLLKTKVFGFFSIIFANEYLFFSFTLSILFAAVIGLTTFNFGTMIRYKIIFLPFFYFLLVRIYTIVVDQKENSSKST